MQTVTFDEFKKLDIRIGTVVSVEKVEGANKLLKLVFDIGGEERQIIAGIAEFFPEYAKLIGKQMPILLNLEPKTFRGATSHGMMLAADVEGTPVLLHPASKVATGSIVR